MSELLKVKIKRRFKTQKAAAAEIGVTRPKLNATLRGRLRPGTRILKWLGLKRVFAYEYDGLPKLD